MSQGITVGSITSGMIVTRDNAEISLFIEYSPALARPDKNVHIMLFNFLEMLPKNIIKSSSCISLSNC